MVTEAQRLESQRLSRLSSSLQRKIPTAQTQNQQLQRKVDDVIEKIKGGEITSLDQIPEDIKQFIDIPEGYFEYQSQAKQIPTQIKEYESRIKNEQNLIQQSNSPYAIARSQVTIKILEDAVRDLKEGYIIPRNSIETAIYKGQTYAPQSVKVLTPEQKARQRIQEHFYKQVGKQYNISNIRQLGIPTAEERSGVKIKTIPQQTTTPQATMFKIQESAFKQAGYSSHEAEILALESVKRQQSFDPATAQQILKNAAIQETLTGQKITAPAFFRSSSQTMPQYSAGSSKIDVARDPTLREAISQSVTSFKHEGFVQGVKTTAQGLYSAIAKPIKKEEAEKQKLERDIAEERTRIVYEDKPYYSSDPYVRTKAFGETSAFTIEETSIAQLEKNVLTGDIASYHILMRKEEEGIEATTKQLVLEEASKNQKKYETKFNSIQDQINKREITSEQGEQELNTFSTNLEEESYKKIESVLDPKIKSAQEKSDKYAKQLKISRIVIGTAASFIVGLYGVGGLLATASQGVRTGAVFMGGTGLGVESVKLSKDVLQGKSGTIEVVGFGLNLAAFGVGAKVGSKIFPSPNIKLNKALEQSDLVINTKGIITEGQITTLDIPEGPKATLTGKLQGGASARKIEVQIRALNTEDQALINKELPYTKIEFVELTDNLGNVIDRVALGKVTIKGKSGKVYKQDIISQSEGIITPEGMESQTLTQIAEKGKIKEAILTEEKATGQLRKFKRGIKIGSGKVDVKLIDKIMAQGRKPLTQSQIKNLLLSFGEGKPVSQSEFLEIQRRANLQFRGLRNRDRAINVLLEQDKSLGVGVSRQVLEVPKKAPKKPKTPLSKTFSEESAKAQKESDILKQAREKITPPIKNLKTKIQRFFRPAPNIEVGVREALSKAGKAIQMEDIKFFSPINVRQIDLNIEKQQEKLRELLSQQPGLTMQDIQKLNSSLGQAQGQQQILSLRLRQIQERVLRQQQIQQPAFQSPQIKIPKPTLPIIKIPFPEIGLGTDVDMDKIRKNLKKLEEKSAGYAPSLSETFFEKAPFEVSEKEFEKLTKTEFSGFEIRPLLTIKKPKKKPSKTKKRKNR